MHADYQGVYTSEKILYLCTIDKIHLKCDVFDGSVENCLGQPILLVSFWVNQQVKRIFLNLRQYNIKKQICFQDYNFLFRR